MMKSVFNNLSRGIFYTIGKVIAFVLIGIAIYFIVQYFNVDIPTVYPELM